MFGDDDNDNDNDDMFRDEFDFEESDSKFEATFDQIGHSSVQNPCNVNLHIDTDGMNEFSIKRAVVKAIGKLEPEDKFKYFTGKYIGIINDNEIFPYKIGQDDILKICEMIEGNDIIHNLNPIAYILGYISTDGGRRMNKKEITYINDNLERILKDISEDEDNKEGSIVPADVIRYARFWMKGVR